MVLEGEIQAAEARLHLRLPPSYRAHMLGGAELPGDHGLTLLPVSEIDRFGRRESAWLAGWTSGHAWAEAAYGSGDRLGDDPADPATLPARQLGDTIVISTTVDERVLLINPATADPGGEWEAWDFANWYPGAYRYPSFARLVEALQSSS